MKSFYMLKFPTMRIYDEHAVIDGLPKGLARAVKMELFQDVLNHCPLFFGMNVGLPVRNSDGKQTLSLEDVGVSVAGDVCTRLQTLYKTEGLELTAEGDLPDALYILRSGKLNVSTRGHDLFVAQSGDILGEMALLGFSKDGRRLRTSKCLTMCELCYITKDSLEELLLVGGFQVPLRRMLACYVEGVFVCVLCADIYIECVCLAFSVCAERRPEHAYPRILHLTDSIDAYTDDICLLQGSPAKFTGTITMFPFSPPTKFRREQRAAK
jgi:CRP-like cAMP-binding protein